MMDKIGVTEPPDGHDKLRELILYVSARYAVNPKWGAVKLNKVLAYSDFEAYKLLGKSITGEDYFKIQFGPAPRKMKPILEEMKATGDIAEIVISFPVGEQKRIAPQREANLKIFSSEEISIVEQFIQFFWEMDASQVIDVSHEMIGWKMTRSKETIPYETAFLCNPEDIVVTDLAMEKAKQIALQ
jgi:hypothetical protein